MPPQASTRPQRLAVEIFLDAPHIELVDPCFNEATAISCGDPKFEEEFGPGAWASTRPQRLAVEIADVEVQHAIDPPLQRGHSD